MDGFKMRKILPLNKTITILVWAAGLSLLSFVFITGCSSGSKKADSGIERGEGSSGSPSASRDEGGSNDEDNSNRSGSRKGNYKDLKEAIEDGNEKAIEKVAGNYLSEDKGDTKTLNALALHHLSKKRYQLARMILKSVLEKDPKNPSALNNLGVVYQSENEPRRALEYFKKAYAVAPNFGPSNANLGTLYARAQDYTKARRHLEKAYDNGIRDLSLLQSYSAALIAEGSDKAEDILDEAKKIDERALGIQWNYATYLVYIKKDFKKAREVLDRLSMMGVSPENKESLRRMEEILSKANDNALNKP